MAVFEKLLDFVSGGIGGKIVDAIAAQFPPSMSEEEREKLKLAIVQTSREYDLELLRIGQQEQETFNDLLKQMEGTASDLNSAGWVGRAVLFFRGAQRPVWGFFVLYLDFKVFSGDWHLSSAVLPQAQAATQASMVPLDLQSAFWVINFLVLGFLFGERAMRNVMPFFQARMGGGASMQSRTATREGAVG